MNAMNRKEIGSLARRLLSQPAAPYHEEAVRDEIERICTEADLPHARDRHGNVLIHWNTAPGLRPLVLAAHMDHPGFEILRGLAPQRYAARFLGGVPPQYFRPGTRLRLFPGAARARLGRRMRGEKTYEITLESSPTPKPGFGVWDVEEVTLRAGRLHARACDDLIGVTAALATLIELRRTKARVNVMAAITRAEEVGFHGALALAADHRLPPDALVVSLETSKEMPPVRMGAGVIIRVGDKASTFDSGATRFLAEAAAGVAEGGGGFRWQRALMSGGTCEATAYQELGYTSAAVCVALGNYHNCGPRNRVAAEYVSVRDVQAMVQLLAGAAREMKRYQRHVGKLGARLERLLRAARGRLKGEMGNPEP
jgi:endoglucanase